MTPKRNGATQYRSNCGPVAMYNAFSYISYCNAKPLHRQNDECALEVYTYLCFVLQLHDHEIGVTKASLTRALWDIYGYHPILDSASPCPGRMATILQKYVLIIDVCSDDFPHGHLLCVMACGKHCMVINYHASSESISMSCEKLCDLLKTSSDVSVWHLPLRDGQPCSDLLQRAQKWRASIPSSEMTYLIQLWMTY